MAVFLYCIPQPRGRSPRIVTSATLKNTSHGSPATSSQSVMSSIEIGHCRVHFCVAMAIQPPFTQAGGQSAIKGKMSQNNLIWIEKYTIDWTMLNCFIYKENGITMHSVLTGRQWLGIQREIYITSIIGNCGETSSITKTRFQHIGPGVTYLDPTLIHLDPAIWGLQGRLWPNFPNLWQFGAILSPSGAPRWQCRKGKKVPTHRPGCDLPWSNLDPPWSSHLGSPGLLMAINGIFCHKWC